MRNICPWNFLTLDKTEKSYSSYILYYNINLKKSLCHGPWFSNYRKWKHPNQASRNKINDIKIFCL